MIVWSQISLAPTLPSNVETWEEPGDETKCKLLYENLGACGKLTLDW